MPVYNSGGLYELTVDDDWSLVESGESNGAWVEVYQYDDVLTPGAATTTLADKLIAKNMTLADYAVISDIDVSMTGYACRVEDVVEIDDAWGYIKSEAGM